MRHENWSRRLSIKKLYGIGYTWELKFVKGSGDFRIENFEDFFVGNPRETLFQSWFESVVRWESYGGGLLNEWLRPLK